MQAFSSYRELGLLRSCSVWASHCSDFSCCRAQSPGYSGFSSCGSRAGNTGSIVVAYRLGCFTACGSLPKQGSNPCLLHWQANFLPLSHQGSPKQISFDLQNIWLFFHGFHFRFQAHCFFIQCENFCLLCECSDVRIVPSESSGCLSPPWPQVISLHTRLVYRQGKALGDPLKFFEVLWSSLLSGTWPYKYFYRDITVI